MTIEIFGQEIHLLFLSEENGTKLLLTTALVLILLTLRWLASGASRFLLRGLHNEKARFWTRQGIDLAVAVLLSVGLLSVWFDDPTRLATAIGLVTAGLAFALQKVITALAGFVVILRGDTFNVGDWIIMGGSAATSSPWGSSGPRSWRWDNHPLSKARSRRSECAAGSTPVGS